MASVIDACMQRARRQPQTVVFPEGTEPRIAAAARQLAAEGIARPILLGNPQAVKSAAGGFDLPGVSVCDPLGSDRALAYGAAIAGRRGRMTPAVAARLVHKPLYFAAAMVAAGDAAAMVAGATCPTRRVIEAALLAIGPASGSRTPSSLFLMERDRGRPLIFADCAVNVEPDAEALADIAIASASSARALLGTEPVVALLSFSTRGSASHCSIERIRSALAIVRRRTPGLAIDGELQADAALDAAVARTKGVEGPVAGRANVLVFPDLNAGNIGYKLVEQLCGARATGPLLQGFARPVCDLSRGARIEDVVAATALTVGMDGNGTG